MQGNGPLLTTLLWIAQASLPTCRSIRPKRIQSLQIVLHPGRELARSLPWLFEEQPVAPREAPRHSPVAAFARQPAQPLQQLPEERLSPPQDLAEFARLPRPRPRHPPGLLDEAQRFSLRPNGFHLPVDEPPWPELNWKIAHLLRSGPSARKVLPPVPRFAWKWPRVPEGVVPREPYDPQDSGLLQKFQQPAWKEGFPVGVRVLSETTVAVQKSDHPSRPASSADPRRPVPPPQSDGSFPAKTFDCQKVGELLRDVDSPCPDRSPTAADRYFSIQESREPIPDWSGPCVSSPVP